MTFWAKVLNGGQGVWHSPGGQRRRVSRQRGILGSHHARGSRQGDVLHVTEQLCGAAVCLNSHLSGSVELIWTSHVPGLLYLVSSPVSEAVGSGTPGRGDGFWSPIISIRLPQPLKSKTYVCSI